MFKGIPQTDHARAANAARGEIEDIIAGHGWPWSRRLSLWLDVLLVLGEGDGA